MAKTLRAWRAERLLSTRGLARLAGASHKTIVQIELGRQTASFATIAKLSRVLDVAPREIIEFARALDARAGLSEPDAPTVTPPELAAPAPQRARIFCVSGSAAFLLLVRRLLEAERYAVTTVIGAPVTFEHVASFQPDVLVLDLETGPLVGPELLERIQREASTHRIPVVVTARDRQLLARVAARRSGPDGAALVVAPFDADLVELVAAVDALALRS